MRRVTTIGKVYNAVAEKIVLDGREVIVVTRLGYLIGYYKSVSEIERDVDLATLTIKE